MTDATSAPETVTTRRRVVLVVAVVALLVGALVADDAERTDRPTLRRATEPNPTVETGVSSSTWYCPMVRDEARGLTEGRVILANRSEQPRGAVVRLVAPDGASAATDVTVEAHSRLTVDPASILDGPATLAARIDVDGGDVAVEHSVSGPEGRSVAPCATSASDEWHVADASTRRGAVATLAVYNPFPAPAIVDLSFATDRGRSEPVALTGFVVEPRRVAIIDMGDHVRRRDWVSATVRARSGRVVVDRLQRVTDGNRGLVLSLASPATSVEWALPNGIGTRGLTQTLVLYNPTDQEADVDVEVRPDEGDAEPVALIVPPFETVFFDPVADELVPAGIGHATVVRSLNDVPVVVERRLVAAEGSTRLGRSVMAGLRHPSTQWIFADGRADDATDERVTLFNPGGEAVAWAISVLRDGQLVPIDALTGQSLGAGARANIKLGDHITGDALPVLVEATGPIYAERGLFAVGALGMSAAPGIPVDARSDVR